MSSIVQHSAHQKKHEAIKLLWDKVTADLNNHGSLNNNDPDFTPLIARNVQARLKELEKTFRAKFLSPSVSLSGSSEWDDERESMKRLYVEKDAEKEDTKREGYTYPTLI